MIKIERLTKRFGEHTVVDNLSFDVTEGEVLGFLGPNGAGKSTTMKMITGFLQCNDGRVTVNGFDVAEDPIKAQQQIGYLPEGAPCYGDMTPQQFLSFVAEVRGFKGADIATRVASVVDKLQLQGVLHQPIDTLSKGFKRRVGLAQAIIHDPKVLILDQPTDGLDPNQKYQVRKLIKNLSKDKIVVISTHILEEVSAVCTRAIVIANGKLVANCTPEELEAQSKYHQSIRLEFEQSTEAALSALSEQEGVAEVESNNDGCVVTVIPNSGDDIFIAVNKLVQQQGWPLKSMYQERGHLDEVFRRITTGQERV